MNKFQFIQQLMDTKKFTLSQKERFFKLVSMELADIGNYNQEIQEDIRLIKERLGMGEVQESKEESPIAQSEVINTDEIINSKEESKSSIKYIDPKGLSEILLEYNQDPILKYTCHTIDSIDSLQNIIEACKTQDYQFKNHLELIHKRYSRLTYKFKDRVLKNIVGLISRYLGTYEPEEGWSEGIMIKWISPELEHWCKENPGKVPNPLEMFQNERFRFSTIELKNGESISNFSDLVIHFKNLFHIKNTNPLKPLLENSIFANYNSDEYDIQFAPDFSDNIDLFTYTETLLQAFIRIINMSKKHHEGEVLKAKLSFKYDEEQLKVLRVIILNSKVFGKNYVDFRGGDDIQNLIKYQINGLCNFYIKAYFNDKEDIGIVNVWDEKPMSFKMIEEDIEGVEFILKMY